MPEIVFLQVAPTSTVLLKDKAEASSLQTGLGLLPDFPSCPLALRSGGARGSLVRHKHSRDTPRGS